MKNMKNQLTNMGGKLVNIIGSKVIEISEQTADGCFFLCLYEPKIPMELLNKNMDK